MMDAPTFNMDEFPPLNLQVLLKNILLGYNCELIQAKMKKSHCSDTRHPGESNLRNLPRFRDFLTPDIMKKLSGYPKTINDRRENRRIERNQTQRCDEPCKMQTQALKRRNFKPNGMSCGNRSDQTSGMQDDSCELKEIKSHSKKSTERINTRKRKTRKEVRIQKSVLTISNFWNPLEFSFEKVFCFGIFFEIASYIIFSRIQMFLQKK